MVFQDTTVCSFIKSKTSCACSFSSALIYTASKQFEIKLPKPRKCCVYGKDMHGDATTHATRVRHLTEHFFMTRHPKCVSATQMEHFNKQFTAPWGQPKHIKIDRKS